MTDQHARIVNGTVEVMFDGRWIADNFFAWGEMISAHNNPHNSPVLAERARQLREALDEVGYLREAA